MEVTYYEDPACSWCWAFQPVATAFAFEFRHMIKVRHVMGGLRDRPAANRSFIVQQWVKAEALSGMPFEPGVWSKHTIDTTFTACRAVKAAAIIGVEGSVRLLRRLREAFFTEQTPIDDIDAILKLADEVGLEQDALRENLASGRAEELFARDRVEADQAGFGFPTINIMSKKQECPVVLQGAVDYGEILDTLFSLGIGQRKRRRFKDSKEDWGTLFKIHRRLTFPEIRLVTGIEKAKLDGRLGELGLRRSGVFYECQDGARQRASAATAQTPAPAASPCASCRPASTGISGNGAPEAFIGDVDPVLSRREAPSSEPEHDAQDRSTARAQLRELSEGGMPN